MGQRREGARPRDVCRDEPTQPQDEDTAESFIGGAGI
jgi:hypothetical protein